MNIKNFSIYIGVLFILQSTISVGLSVNSVCGNLVVAFLLYCCLNNERSMFFVYITMLISLVYEYFFMGYMGILFVSIFLAGFFVCFVKNYFVTEGFLVPNIIVLLGIILFYISKIILLGIILKKDEILSDIYTQFPYIIYTFLIFFAINIFSKFRKLRRV